MKTKINIKKIGLFTVILLYISAIILQEQVNNLDEIWNFNFARCMANGLVPYRDFNIIQGPLLPFICSIFLRIFGQEMLITRFLAIILDTCVLYLTYSIMTKLNVKQYLKYLILILLAIIMKPYFTIDYNWAGLLITLIIIKIELNQKNPIEINIKQDLVVGLLAGISILFKQTIGLLIVTATVGYKLLQIRKKEDFIKFIKIASIRLIASVIPFAVMIIFLYFQNALTDYIDYCILGLSTFSNKISYVDSLIKGENIIIRILSILPIFVYLTLIYIYIKKQKKEALILLTFSMVQLILVYPISDASHFVIAIEPTIISIGYLLNLLIEKTDIPKIEEIVANNFLKSLIILSSIIFFISGIKIYRLQNINTELKHFKYLPMGDTSNIKEIDKFIEEQEKDVYILDAVAALYMIPTDKYNKNYDMFLKGNLGSKGEDGQINNLKSTSQKIILIMNKNYRRNWQNPEKVRKWVQTEMNKTGEIGIFDIYE